MKSGIIAAAACAAAILLCSCTVNEQTGLIQINNLTNLTLTDIYIGNTLIAFRVGPGVQYDYWVLSSFTGELSMTGPDEGDLVLADETTVKNVLKDAKFTIKPGYFYQLRIYINDNGESVAQMRIDKFDQSASASSTYDVVN